MTYFPEFRTRILGQTSTLSRVDSFTLSQNLTQLRLSNLAIDGTLLSESIGNCAKTLKKLRLKEIFLCDGTWRTIFTLLRAKLHLKCFIADRLMEGPLMVLFTSIHRQRPLAIDKNVLRLNKDPRLAVWNDFSSNYKSMQEAVEHGWVWVQHNCSYRNKFTLALDADYGDDVNAWLALVEEGYKLELF
jgi:hypothetical protein